MKKLVVGILAHVDAGKTTLSEAMLYLSGQLRTLGRVDHRDAFLDTFALERERGITIFSKQAVLPLSDVEVTLLDTPGHVDFSAEAERALQVLDCAILVVSGTDGVQGHTLTLWRLLERYRVPTFLFVNKMDLPGADRAALFAELRRRLSGNCVDFGESPEMLSESIAMCDEGVLTRYLENGTVSDGEIAGLIERRDLFPCLFGAALRLEGVDALLDTLARYAPQPEYPDSFAARVYKITRDAQGGRLTCLKVTGGILKVKTALSGARAGEAWQEKVDQIRIYSGAKYQTVEKAVAGTVCAVTGLSRTYPGEGLGEEAAAAAPLLEPVLAYQVLLPRGCDPHSALVRLRELEEEDPQLHIAWNEQLHQIHIHLMGAVQLEILQRLIADRFGLEVTFGPGNIVYRETIAAPVIGIGHFEPLRHYAEVHLLLEPGKPGSGVQVFSACPEEMLDRTWQRLILTHLEECSHPGVLTGSPVTDLRITLVAGRAHDKHTEGGDFRQATYRAVRQGLLQARNILLEPWYGFRLALPTEQVGRAMSDLQQMSGTFSPPETAGDEAVLIGSAPAACLRDYGAELAAYTRGRGHLSCALIGYRPCHNQDEVVAAAGYDPERDTEHPADSVFCAHGAGYSVRWDEVAGLAHVTSGISLAPPPEEPPESATGAPTRSAAYTGSIEQNRELQAIFERTYGPVKRREFLPPRAPSSASASDRKPAAPVPSGPEYLLVDGYNIIFAWDELKAVAADNLDAARQLLMDLLCNYQGFHGGEIILVFDAYKVPRGIGEVSRYHNIHVVYTKEAETADAYIERATYQIGREHRVRVATSDGPEQLIILGHGALRLSADAFHQEMRQVLGQISGVLSRNNQPNHRRVIKAAMQTAMQAAHPDQEEKNPPS